MNSIALRFYDALENIEERLSKCRMTEKSERVKRASDKIVTMLQAQPKAHFQWLESIAERDHKSSQDTPYMVWNASSKDLAFINGVYKKVYQATHDQTLAYVGAAFFAFPEMKQQAAQKKPFKSLPQTPPSKEFLFLLFSNEAEAREKTD